jgi:hypothetical protein
MKRIMGTILSCAFVAGSAHGGSIGGTSPGNASSLFYYPNGYGIFVPDYLDDYIVITKRGTRIDSDFKTYSLDSRDFGRLQDVADSYSYVNVKGENNTSRSYRVRSGDEANKVELIDRRLEMRNGVAP